MNRVIFAFMVLVFPIRVFSQDSLLTLKQAIEITLKNNYDIRIAKNSGEQQENNNTIGNAGMLPDVDVDGSYTRSSNTIKQKYPSGSEVNRAAAATTNTNLDAGATWTIFDGLKMFNTKEKLSELSLSSQDQLKIQIENSLLEVITAYYSIVRKQQLLKALREELKYSEERVKIADRKQNNGSGSRLEWLQAKTDYNRQRSLEVSLLTDIYSVQKTLNRLLGRNVETNFSIVDTVIITYKPVFEDLKKTVNEQNNYLNFYRRNQNIARLELKENQSLRYPVIDINARYVFSKNTSEAGLTLLNQAYGFNYGATATIPLFHGFNISRQIKNSKLDVLNSDIIYESVSAQVTTELFNTWTEFGNNLQLLQLEEQNIGYAQEVLTISQQRYRVGVSSAVEQEDAQRTFEESMVRLADARFNAKISETRLMKLNGELVK